MSTPGDHESAAVDRLRAHDDALLAEATAPPSLEEAREAYSFWSLRLATLPRYKRTERAEAEQMAARWQMRVTAAERDHYGPGLVEQLLSALGVRAGRYGLPSRRKVFIGLGAAAVLTMLVVIGLLVAMVVFWPEVGPIVRSLINSDGGG